MEALISFVLFGIMLVVKDYYDYEHMMQHYDQIFGAFGTEE